MTEQEPLGLIEDVEQDIVALSLTDTDFFLDVYEFLKPNHFSNDVAARSWEMIRAFFMEYHRLPRERELRQVLKSGYDLEPEAEYFDPDKIVRDRTLEETLKLIRDSEFKKFVFRCADEADKNDPDFGRLQEEFKKVLLIEPMSNLGLFYFDVDERFQKIKALKKDRIETGIPIVDRALKGGVAAGELVAFAAPSGTGKSYMLCIAGGHMLKAGKKNIVHYTLEMNEEVTSLRYDMAILSKTETEIMIGNKKIKERLLEIQKDVEKNLVIKEFPTKGASVSTLRTHLQKLKEQKAFIPDVIIVDYGDIMKSSHRYNSRYEEQGSIFQELRGLAQELKVPILTATQTNRGAVGKDVIGQEDLGDSYDKARIMDALFTIVQSKEDKEDGLLKMYEAKVRNGASGKIYGYKMDYERAQINEVGIVEDDDE